MLNGLDLFSGIGGLTRALVPWVRPVSYCEIDRFAQAVLLSRMDSGDLPVAPIWDDIVSLGAAQLPPIDIIYGGFPCQDISVAGNGVGLAGERSGLFFEIARLVGEIRPRFVFLENVPAIRTKGADTVCGRLAELGYDCRWGVLSAADMGAPHIRERWWLLAHAGDGRQRSVLQPQRKRGSSEEACAGRDGEIWALADTHSVTSRRSSEPRNQRNFWAVEPDVGRVANGVPLRVDRLRGLGNSVVPQCAREAFCRLIGLKE